MTEQLEEKATVGWASSSCCGLGSSVNSETKKGQECHPGGSHGLAQVAPRSDLEAKFLMKKKSVLTE